MSDESPLGKSTIYASEYDPKLLFAIPRRDSRDAIGLTADLPFRGCDIWNAWELTWLGPNGVPRAATAEIRVPAESANIIESKSLKLYLGSFSMTEFASVDDVNAAVQKDLSQLTESDIKVALTTATGESPVEEFAGECIDSVDTKCTVYTVDASLLRSGGDVISQSLHSHLLRSLCPVTDQPDIGSISISYHGPRIDHAGLLRYIVSYREHNDFHEACVERMFVDILERCGPEQLTVYARYQRRGGIDINPFRSNFESDPPNTRLWRQ